ncbi:AAA domain-containing protein [Parabacteroides pacaensis]|uniref:AAA domain-containing protein n=1 Tax=Parabacteroides pacaensis TaxID=2086575 RepID=UPI000D0F89BF|nr:AAA domain-containing protein [Parabacteroides pacaensis]
MTRFGNPPSSSDQKVSTSLSHLEQHYKLLQMEYEYEKESYQKQSLQGGIHHNIQQGVCWFPVAIGSTYYNSLNQLTVEIERLDYKDTEHNFEYGKPICFFKYSDDGKIHYYNFTATINYVQENKLVAILPNIEAAHHLQNPQNLGLQLYFDETSYRFMFHALSEIKEARNNRMAELREILVGHQPAMFRKAYPLRFPWLNNTQETAVNQVLCAKDVAIVHGPPGTGKTTTLVEAIYETLHRENQVLVCAQSNTAVDWISEKLLDRGIHVLRIGNPTRVNDKMLSFTYERQFEAHPDYPELWSIRKAIRDIYTHRKKGDYQERDSMRNHLSKLRNRATELEIKINEALFTDARVIASTLVSAASKTLGRRHFSTLFIDEAAQAIEAACWIGINKADRVILAGDYCQLPPTIQCREAAQGGLDKTLIQEIAYRKPQVVSLLKVQYRMHDDIMEFPSRWFYNNELKSAPEVKHRGILQFDTPMIWYNTTLYQSHETNNSNSPSRINKEEAVLSVNCLRTYICKIGEERVLEEQIDFGLISPYKAQVQYLRQLVKRNSFFRPFRKLITIHTVDGFQGQERDVILISLVRANEKGQIGFLTDLRRMNVAITRARMKLIIIGDADTLTQHRFYQQLYQYIEERGAIIHAEPLKENLLPE